MLTKIKHKMYLAPRSLEFVTDAARKCFRGITTVFFKFLISSAP